MPAVVIGGYLGAGKTTLVNHVLREEAARPAGRRIAVLVNDFGEISIDADLIQGADGEVLSLPGGCVCCSFGADLVGTLAHVLRRAPAPQVVLIECSGVGLPAAVARTAALVPGLAVQGCVVVADAAAVRQQAADRYVGDTVHRQLHEADLLLLTRLDLLAAGEAAAVQAWLRAVPMAGPCVPATHGEVAAEVVLGVEWAQREVAVGDAVDAADLAFAAEKPSRTTVGQPLSPRPLAGRAPAAAAQRFIAQTRRFAQPVDVQALGDELLAAGALRAKGVLLDERSGQWLELQLAGRRLSVAAWSRADAPAQGRLVSIHLRGAAAG
ncbi:MAG: GTP-binding protein [Rubrivivax sp.]|nr:GTP-binding protein [Rubrivivax sp.]